MEKTNWLHTSLRVLFCVMFTAGLVLFPTQPAQALTYTVNSLADTNDGTCNTTNCTLREAINAANASTYVADTILFGLSGTITLTASLPGVLMTGDDLTIDGTGHTIRINGNDHYRVLWTEEYADLTLKHLIIEEGYASNMGAGVYNHGTLTVDSCTFTKNVAGDYGGAIYSLGTLTVTNSSLSYNLTGFLNGGAIYVYTGTLATIKESIFLYNDASFNGGAIYNNGRLEIDDTVFLFNEASNGSGGAIFNRHNLEMQDATFSANFAYFDGGALYNDNQYDNFFIYDSDFNNNLAYRDGGGAFIFRTDLGSNIRGSKFSHNSALNDGGGLHNYGGVIYIYQSVFNLNEAGKDGGGIANQGLGLFFPGLNLYDTTIESNTAGQDGGGIYNTDDLHLSGATVNGNQVDRNGGGIFTDGTGNINNCTFFDNRADKGGGLYNIATYGLRDCTFSANRADSSGGAVFGDDHTSLINTILADSLVSGNCGREVGDDPVLNGGGNIDSGTTCSFGTFNNSMSSTDPLLGPLQFNGGWTKTMALQTGSPAIEGVIFQDSCNEQDQRGYPRPFGARCDIGAFEAYYRLFMPQLMKQ